MPSAVACGFADRLDPSIENDGNPASLIFDTASGGIRASRGACRHYYRSDTVGTWKFCRSPINPLATSAIVCSASCCLPWEFVWPGDWPSRWPTRRSTASLTSANTSSLAQNLLTGRGFAVLRPSLPRCRPGLSNARLSRMDRCCGGLTSAWCSSPRRSWIPQLSWRAVCSPGHYCDGGESDVGPLAAAVLVAVNPLLIAFSGLY